MAALHKHPKNETYAANGGSPRHNHFDIFNHNSRKNGTLPRANSHQAASTVTSPLLGDPPAPPVPVVQPVVMSALVKSDSGNSLVNGNLSDAHDTNDASESQDDTEKLETPI